MNGYVKLFRAIEKWEWYTDVNTKTLFIHCLIKANHKTMKWRGIMIETGSFVTSYIKLAHETGLSVREIRTSLKRLKSTQEVTHETTSDYSIISLVNWSLYQSNDDDSDTVNDTVSDKQVTRKRQASDTQTTTNKNNKNIKNIKNKEYSGVFETYSIGQDELKSTLQEFEQMRIKAKKPMTEKAKTLLVGKLEKLGKNTEERIELLNQSILNNWVDVYPLKDKQNKYGKQRIETVTDYSFEGSIPNEEEQEKIINGFRNIGKQNV